MTSRFARTGVLAAAAVAALGIAGTAAPAAASSGGTDVATDVSGSITVLTQRTDIVDTVFADYKKKFEAKYPDVDVKFEAITDYEGEVRIRMNTKDYGDVLLIPNSVTADQLADFFEPLGTVDELKTEVPVRHRAGRRRQGLRPRHHRQRPGLRLQQEGLGRGRHHRAAEDAGRVPRRPAGDQGQDRRHPALHQLQGRLAADPVGGQPRRPSAATRTRSNKLAHDDAPWAPGKEHYIIDSLLYDAVKAGAHRGRPDHHRTGRTRRSCSAPARSPR